METPEYIKRAQNKYNSKFDLVQLKLPKGTKKRIKSITEESYNAYIKRLILEDLESAQNASIGAEKAGTMKSTEYPAKSVNKPNTEQLYSFYGEKIHDIYTQIEIQEKYGNDVLMDLCKHEKNKRKEKEHE